MVDRACKDDQMDHWDNASLWSYFLTPTTAASFLLSLALSLLVSPAVSPLLTSKYRSLGRDKRTFDTLWASTLHAVAVAAMSLYLLAHGLVGTDPHSRVDSPRVPLAFSILQTSLGYFAADFTVCMSDEKLRVDRGSLLHHLVGLSSLVVVLSTRGGYMYFILLSFLSEFSTPFLNLFYVMRLTSNEASRWFTFASVGMLVSFFLCRIVVMPWHWYAGVTSMLHPTLPSSRLVSIRVFEPLLLIHFVVLDVLNIYWFGRMVRGGLKKLKQRQSGKQD